MRRQLYQTFKEGGELYFIEGNENEGNTLQIRGDISLNELAPLFSFVYIIIGWKIKKG